MYSKIFYLILALKINRCYINYEKLSNRFDIPAQPFDATGTGIGFV